MRWHLGVKQRRYVTEEETEERMRWERQVDETEPTGMKVCEDLCPR